MLQILPRVEPLKGERQKEVTNMQEQIKRQDKGEMANTYIG